jgi:hypothetical protein
MAVRFGASRRRRIRSRSGEGAARTGQLHIKREQEPVDDGGDQVQKIGSAGRRREHSRRRIPTFPGPEATNDRRPRKDIPVSKAACGGSGD